MRVFCDCIVYPEGCPGVKGVTGRSLGRAKLHIFSPYGSGLSSPIAECFFEFRMHCLKVKLTDLKIAASGGVLWLGNAPIYQISKLRSKRRCLIWKRHLNIGI